MGEMLFTGLFETLPGRVQCEMLLKVTEQCFNTLERSEMLLLLLRRFPETVVQHGVGEILSFSLRKDYNCLSVIPWHALHISRSCLINLKL